MSSSSSDDEVTRPKVRREGSRTIRNLGSLLKQKSEGGGVTEHAVQACNVYTSRITSRPALLAKDMQLAADIEEDGDLFGVKSKKQPVRKGLVKKGRSRKKKEEEEEEEEEKEKDSPSPYKNTLLDDSITITDDSQISIPSPQKSFREKSPSPPPELVSDAPALPKRGKRKSRGFHKANMTLDRMCEKYETVTRTHAVNEDDDCVILVSPPPKPPSERKTLNVKVRSRSGIQRFSLRQDEEFGAVFREMARHEYVEENRVSICHKDAPIRPYDTPSSIGLAITDILDCYVRKTAAAVGEDDDDDDDPDVIHLTVQGKDPRSRRTLTLLKTQPLERMMRKYAHSVRVPYDRLEFLFDGETLQPQRTADDFDLEEDYCIDVAGV